MQIINIETITIAILAIGLFLNFWQLRKANAQIRGDIVSDALWKIYDDPELREVYYPIESEKFSFKKEDYNGSEIAQKVDRLITIFDILAKRYNLKLVKMEDIDYLRYEYLAVYQNKKIQKYLEYLADYNIDDRPFSQFIELGELLAKKYPE